MADDSQLFQINLNRPDSSFPWGFRLEGGADLPVPLNIMSVNPGGLSERAGLQAGDHVLQINGRNASGMTHEDAKMEIIRSGNDFTLTVERRGQTIWKPKVVPVEELNSNNITRANYSDNSDLPMVTQTSLAANRPNIRQIGSSHNVTPVPFGAQMQQGVITQGSDGRTKKVVHSQYNSPMGLYQGGDVANTFQSRVEEAQGLNERPSAPSGFRSVQAPTSGVPGPSPSAVQQSMYCGVCNEFIKGVFIKVQNKIPMHPNCLKCSKCGVGLRNIGYFYIDDKLYCETHAKQVAKPPGPDMKPIASYQ